MPFRNRSVGGDRVALPHDQNIPLANLGERHGNGLPVAFDCNRVGRKGKQAFHLPARPLFTALFQPFPERDERDDHRRGLEKQNGRVRRENRRNEAVYKGYDRAERDEGVHIRHKLHGGAHPAYEKAVVDPEYQKRQRQLKAVIPPAVRDDRMRDHVPHRQVHFGHHQREREKKTKWQREAALLFLGCVAVIENPVTERLYRGGDLRGGHLFAVELRLHALTHQGDGARGNPVHLFYRALDPRSARRTGHARDTEFLFH